MSGCEGLARAILDLQALAVRLRRECPWDREQTVQTIVPHTIEEAYEVADASESGNDAMLVDELGDLLFQIVFLALLLEERGASSLEQVARAIERKLVARHPHVFGDDLILSAAGVRERWEQLKTEREGRTGIFHGMPAALPALLRAKKAQQRAGSVGFDYPDVQRALDDLEEELGELRGALGQHGAAPETPPDALVAAEVGDLLFACVNVSRRASVDPEVALRAATGRFVSRVEEADRRAAADGLAFAALSLDEQDRYFDDAKRQLEEGASR